MGSPHHRSPELRCSTLDPRRVRQANPSLLTDPRKETKSFACLPRVHQRQAERMRARSDWFLSDPSGLVTYRFREKILSPRDDLRLGTKKYTSSLDATIKIVKAEGPMGLYRGVVPTIMKQGTNHMVRFPIQQFYFKAFFGNDAEKRSNPWLNGLCGAAAGGTSVLLTMPQDTVKTRMQGEAAKKLYKGTLDCVKQIIQKEGVLFLYTGTWPRFIRVSLDVGITFTIYPLLSKYF